MPRVAFAYPDDVRAAWRSYGVARGAREGAAAAATKPDGAANFHFDYTISGDSPSWRPVRVFASGAKT
jgi:type IV secretion system protein VirB9